MAIRVFSLAAIVWCLHPAAAQTLDSRSLGFRSLDIRIPESVLSETLFIRYCLAGSFGSYCSWEEPKPRLSAYSIRAVHEGVPAVSIKAVLYAPGCEIETVELPVLTLNALQYSFACRALPATSLSGVVTHAERLYGRKVELHAHYLAYWLQTFFGYADGAVISIPVGEAGELTASNHFLLSIPDLSKDPIAGMRTHEGVLQVWARDKETGELVALLSPSPASMDHSTTGKPSNTGGLRIEPFYPAELSFQPCAVNGPLTHDHTGFAIRPDRWDACN